MRATHYCENGEAKVCGIWVGKWHCSGGGIHFNTTNNDYCYYYHVFMAASGTHTHTRRYVASTSAWFHLRFSMRRISCAPEENLICSQAYISIHSNYIQLSCDVSLARGGRESNFSAALFAVCVSTTTARRRPNFCFLYLFLLLLLFVNLHLIAFPHKFWFVDFSRAWTQKHAYNKCSTCTMHENMKHHWWWFIEPHEFGCACIWQKL